MKESLPYWPALMFAGKDMLAYKGVVSENVTLRSHPEWR
jgi:hypothetical protein